MKPNSMMSVHCFYCFIMTIILSGCYGRHADLSLCETYPCEIGFTDVQGVEESIHKATISHKETVVHVGLLGEPTLIKFPSKILGGFKRKEAAVALDRKDKFLVVFAKSNLSELGEPLLVSVEQWHEWFPIRIMPANADFQRDVIFKIHSEKIIKSDESNMNDLGPGPCE